MFGIPIGLILRGAMVLAVALACWYLYERVQHWCNTACHTQTQRADKLKSDWDAAIAAQQAREVAAAKEADDFQRRADAKRDSDFKALVARRTTERDTALASERVAAATLAELRDTVRAANATGSGQPALGVGPVTGTTNGLSLNNWFAVVAEKYRKCREHEIGWLEWDDNRVKGQ